MAISHRSIGRIIAFAGLTLLSVSAFAYNESLTFRLAGSGEVEAVVSGLSDGPECRAEFVPATSVTVVGTTITITSPYTPYSCLIPNPYTPYEVAASLGHLDSSTYQVTWSEGPFQLTATVSAVDLPVRISGAHLFVATPLGTLGGPYSRGLAINNSGQVTGYASTADGHVRAFLHAAGPMTDLGPPGGDSGGTAINASAQVTGSYTASPGLDKAFLYSSGTFTDLGASLDNGPSTGTGINDLGQVVGQGSTSSGSFLYSGGVMSDLGLAYGVAGKFNASGINASGQVAATQCCGEEHAFVYSPGKSTDLGTFGGKFSLATAISDVGQVTGTIGFGDTGQQHAFLFAETMLDLGVLGMSPSLNSAGIGVNGSGHVVGYSELTGSLASHAFLSTGVPLHDLNALVSSGLDGATLTEATGINDHDQIVANYCFPVSIIYTVCNAFRLDPIPPPTVVAVEYYYEAWNYYFETSSPDEIAILDGGAFGGVWKRTGETFNVWPQTNTSSSPTCRFFSNAFAPKSTHVYTPFASECATLKADRNWQYEGIAFHVQLADTAGLCAAGTIPLYRLYNNGMGGAPNHRYTTSETIRDQMTTLGWIFEGNGNTGVFACVPQ